MAIEANGYAMGAYELMEQNGIICYVAHPMKLRLIGESKLKTDKIDSEILANLLRTNYLPKAYIPDREIREIRDILRHRQDIVDEIVRIKNRVHALLAKNMIDIKKEVTDVFGKRGREILRNLELSRNDRFRLDSYLRQLEFYESELENIEDYLSVIAYSTEEVRLIMTIPGIGPITALTIVAEIGDISRFRDSRKLAAYCGLTPSIRASGDKIHMGHVRKDTNSHLKRVLVEAAHIAIRYPGNLKRFYLRLSRRRGKQIAIVATARKLIRIIYAMLTSGERYRDEDPELTERKIYKLMRKAKKSKNNPSPPHSTVACAEPSPSARRPYNLKKSRMRMELNPTV